MMYIVHPSFPRKISDVCLKLNFILCSQQFFYSLHTFKNEIPGSNIDGSSLVSEFNRIRSRNSPIRIEPYWAFNGFSKEENGVIYINTRFLKGITDSEYCKMIASLTVNVIDSCSPYWFQQENDYTFYPSPHAIVGRIALNIFKEEARTISRMKGVHDYGTEFGGDIQAEENHHHFVD